MNMRKALIRGAALYALGRFTSRIRINDIGRWANIASDLSPDDIKKYLRDASDEALFRVGLQRRSTVPSSALLVMGGVGAGLLVGAGLGVFFMTGTGREIRSNVAQRVRDIRHHNGAAEVQEPPTASPPSA